MDAISELQAEAAEARALALTFDDAATIADLENYAAALDAMATEALQAMTNGVQPPSLKLSGSRYGGSL